MMHRKMQPSLAALHSKMKRNGIEKRGEDKEVWRKASGSLWGYYQKEKKENKQFFVCVTVML